RVDQGGRPSTRFGIEATVDLLGFGPVRLHVPGRAGVERKRLGPAVLVVLYDAGTGDSTDEDLEIQNTPPGRGAGCAEIIRRPCDTARLSGSSRLCRAARGG